MKKIVFLLPIILLCACSGNVKSSLGLNKNAPDEFTIISYPPLSIPPEFNPSHLLSSHPLMPVEVPKSNYTLEETMLLKRMSLILPNTNVKQSLEVEHKEQQKKLNDRGLITQTLGASIKDEPVVDAAKEKLRINKNMKEGTPVNKGVIENKAERSTIEKIFGR